MVPMTAEEIEDWDRMRRQLHKQLTVLGEILEANGVKPSPLSWIPTRELVAQGPNLELARLDDAAPAHD